MLAWGALPPVVGGCFWGVFRGCFGVLTVFTFAFVWCLVLYSYCIDTVLLECGLTGVFVSFCVLVSLLGGFPCVSVWCSIF